LLAEPQPARISATIRARALVFHSMDQSLIYRYVFLKKANQESNGCKILKKAFKNLEKLIKRPENEPVNLKILKSKRCNERQTNTLKNKCKNRVK
jgi:hypothetical protein